MSGSEEKPDFVTNANVEQKGYEQLTGLAAAKGFQNIPAQTDKALIRITGQDVRMRDDGQDPTALLGMPLLTTDLPFIYEADLANVRFIEIDPGAVIDVLYYKNKGNS